VGNADDIPAIHERYLKALDAFREATDVITEHMRKGTIPTATERQREADAVAAFNIARGEYLRVAHTAAV
jgi:hypothetical protein